MDYILISINLIFPMILLALIGYFLKKKNIINNNFENISSRIVFNLALPVTMFSSIVNVDIKVEINKDILNLLLFLSIMLVIIGLFAYFSSSFLTNSKKTKGSYFQGILRGNFIIIGYPILENLFGNEVVLPMTLAAAVIVPIVNIFSVIMLSVNNPDVKKLNYKEIILNIFKNPLILSILLGIVFSFFNVTIPIFLNNTFTFIKGLTTPLALIGIGSMFTFSLKMKDFKIQIISLIIKSIIIPIFFILIGIILGFRNEILGVIFIALVTPVPPSAYVMSKNMNSDYTYSANNIVITTAFSSITIFIGIIVLKYFSLI